MGGSCRLAVPAATVCDVGERGQEESAVGATAGAMLKTQCGASKGTWQSFRAELHGGGTLLHLDGDSVVLCRE